MDYNNYSKWKGWVEKKPFNSLNKEDEIKFTMQLNKLNLRFKKIKVLELGYGNGSFLKFLSKNNCEVHGIEIQKNLLKEAKSFKYKIYDSVLKINDNNFDLIVGFDVLEHMTVDQLNEFFAQASKLLSKSGSMVFRFPNAESFAGLGAQNGDFTHITAIARTKLDQIIKPFNLEITSFEGEIEYPKKIFVSFFRTIFRYILMKGMGVGSKHFFSTNVVALVKFSK